ncbi:hypothetical protein HMPREF0004_5688 [Achromobacter piechaudii ATCC 43553]|uniref:Uncharacterized protein n=1 Tax=Achromobacter piechaudii ATCC 43553 TaxID=742159 RepID=D4XJP1_9BURK|nr:hypothetical protein HMPREF0004_5688 [Achromobacter piechaudii ATCC 43553]
MGWASQFMEKPSARKPRLIRIGRAGKKKPLPSQGRGEAGALA